VAGRSVKLFLVDGTPQGLRTAEVGNWTGLALMCPRTDLARLGTRAEARRTGVYLLVGPSEEEPSRSAVYVGEGDEVWARLRTHDTKKDFWTAVVLFVSKDDNLTKAHVRWLEASLVRAAREAKRADVNNENDPVGGRLPEADTADMGAFFENIRLLLPVLGVDVLGAPGAEAATRPDEVGALVLELQWQDAHAECVVRDGQFVVRVGSTARVKEVQSLSDGYRAQRRTLREAGVLVPLNSSGLLRFTQDYAFDSPSAAAAVVSGTGLNGRKEWEVKGTGLSYKDWQDHQVGEPA
jgi:hypothetical protein